MARTKKVVETTEAQETKNIDPVELELQSTDDKDMIKTLMAQMAELQKQVEESKKEKTDLEKLVEILENSKSKTMSLSGKKIKLINMMHNVANVSTEPYGQGRVFTFNKYGDTRYVKYDDLADILSVYPYTMKNGLIYIADKEAVEELGLTEEYQNIYSKEVMDKIMLLREEVDVDLFIGMEENMRESMAIEIANKINQNESMDYNYLRRIKNETGIDIEQIAKDIKENYSKDTKEDE